MSKETYEHWQVTDAAIGDLGHYSKALDWAVSHFHNERMKHINDIIGDLWTQIYCGNDIDTIKIKIDEEITQGKILRCNLQIPSKKL